MLILETNIYITSTCYVLQKITSILETNIHVYKTSILLLMVMEIIWNVDDKNMTTQEKESVLYCQL